MTNTQSVKPPAWFWVVGVLALLWNLMGAGAYLADAFTSIEALEQMSQDERLLFESRPAWVTAAFATAVWGGTIGCIGLLLRKKWAKTILVLSLLGVIAHQIYMFFLSNTFEVMGSNAMLLPIIVLVVAIALVLLARSAEKKKWIS